MKRKKMCIAATAGISLLMATTAMAGTWRTGIEPNQNRWWYDNDDGTYVKNEWQWIDGNGDGVAESYYFDADGWLLTSTTTPDGYTVNENGAWVENGAVQTQSVSTAAAAESLTTGFYRYYKTDIFDENAKEYVSHGQIYDGTSESLENILANDRYAFGIGEPGLDWNLKIEEANDQSFTVYPMVSPEYPETKGMLGVVYNKTGDKWQPTDIEGASYYILINDKDTFTFCYPYSPVDRETGNPSGKNYTAMTVYKRIQ